MTALQLLANLRTRGVVLSARGDRLAFDAPAGVMTPDLRAVLASRKRELLAMLASVWHSAAKQDILELSSGKHWTYRAWSRVLDAEVWFVCCEQEVTQLAAMGVACGCIYTEAELVELLQLPKPLTAKALKNLHAVKSYFAATVVPVDE